MWKKYSIFDLRLAKIVENVREIGMCRYQQEIESQRWRQNARAYSWQERLMSVYKMWISKNCGFNLLVGVYGAMKLSKCLLKYDLDGDLYPDLQPWGLPLASRTELKAPDTGKAGGCLVLRSFLRDGARLWRLDIWCSTRKEPWRERRRRREDGCVGKVRGSDTCGGKGCFGRTGGGKDRCEYGGGYWRWP